MLGIVEPGGGGEGFDLGRGEHALVGAIGLALVLVIQVDARHRAVEGQEVRVAERVESAVRPGLDREPVCPVACQLGRHEVRIAVPLLADSPVGVAVWSRCLSEGNCYR